MRSVGKSLFVDTLCCAFVGWGSFSYSERYLSVGGYRRSYEQGVDDNTIYE